MSAIGTKQTSASAPTRVQKLERGKAGDGNAQPFYILWVPAGADRVAALDQLRASGKIAADVPAYCAEWKPAKPFVRNGRTLHVRDGRVRLYTMNGADWSKRYPLIIEAGARLKVPRYSMQRWFGLIPRAFRTSRHCTAVSTMLLAPLPLRSICLWPTETICDVGHMSNGKRRCGNCYEAIAASNMSNTPRGMAIGCSMPSAPLALKELSRRIWIHLIGRGRPRPGSKSKIRTRPLQLGLKTVRSEHHL